MDPKKMDVELKCRDATVSVTASQGNDRVGIDFDDRYEKTGSTLTIEEAKRLRDTLTDAIVLACTPCEDEANAFATWVATDGVRARGEHSALERPWDPVWEAVQSAEPRTTPLSDEMKEKRERGLREVAARHDPPGAPVRLEGSNVCSRAENASPVILATGTSATCASAHEGS
jgi:hypothetical protein